MPDFKDLDFSNMMGNLASELSRVERVLKNNDTDKVKLYLWKSLELTEIIKAKFPNSETFRLFEFLAYLWAGSPTLKEVKSIQKYTLAFYLNSLNLQRISIIQ